MNLKRPTQVPKVFSGMPNKVAEAITEYFQLNQVTPDDVTDFAHFEEPSNSGVWGVTLYLQHNETRPDMSEKKIAGIAFVAVQQGSCTEKEFVKQMGSALNECPGKILRRVFTKGSGGFMAWFAIYSNEA